MNYKNLYNPPPMVLHGEDQEDPCNNHDCPQSSLHYLAFHAVRRLLTMSKKRCDRRYRDRPRFESRGETVAQEEPSQSQCDCPSSNKCDHVFPRHFQKPMISVKERRKNGKSDRFCDHPYRIDSQGTVELRRLSHSNTHHRHAHRPQQITPDPKQNLLRTGKL